MSYAFIASLRKNPNQSYVQLLNSIRDELEGKYDQKPQLSCSHPLSKSPQPYFPKTMSLTGGRYRPPVRYVDQPCGYEKGVQEKRTMGSMGGKNWVESVQRRRGALMVFV